MCMNICIYLFIFMSTYAVPENKVTHCLLAAFGIQ